MTRATIALTLISFVGCGGGGSFGNFDQKLRFVSSDSSIVLETNQTVVLQLLVVGVGSNEAVISSPDLPAFATLDGSRLTLAPGRSYEGDYLLTLLAKTPSSTASSVLHVSVTRRNTPPSVSLILVSDPTGIWPACNPMLRTSDELHGLASVDVVVSDAEGDAVTIEAEVVPKGQAFSGVATHSITASVGVNHASRCTAGGANQTCIELPFVGLQTGKTYSFALRIRDQIGANADLPYEATPAGDGWWTNSFSCWSFALVP